MIHRFSDYVLDCRQRELRGRNGVVPLEPQVFDLLALLVERRNEVVTRDALIEAVWHGRIVSDATIDARISAARRAICDSGADQGLIRTIPRRGFRFVGEVVTEPDFDRAPSPPSIAVLPFENMSGDPQQSYFADGIAEDLISALARIPWLIVMARNSSFAWHGEKLDSRTIAGKLGVRYLVEGSVRKGDQRLRLAAQLIEASSGNHLWADRYDVALTDIFEVQDQIVTDLVGALEPKLRATEVARARRKRPDTLDAFDLLLQALPKLVTVTRDGLADAIELLDRAIALSPAYGPALAHAAWCRALRPLHGISPDPARDLREASRLARQALDADPDDPTSLRAAGLAVVLVDRDYQAGWDFLDRSLAIDCNSALTWGLRGWISLWAGDGQTATAELERALRLSPFDSWLSTYANGMAFALNMCGRSEESLPWARKCMHENPHWSASHRQLIASLWLTGRHTEARAAVQRYLAIEPNFTVTGWVEAGPFSRSPGQQRVFAALRDAGLSE